MLDANKARDQGLKGKAWVIKSETDTATEIFEKNKGIFGEYEGSWKAKQHKQEMEKLLWKW